MSAACPDSPHAKVRTQSRICRCIRRSAVTGRKGLVFPGTAGRVWLSQCRFSKLFDSELDRARMSVWQGRARDACTLDHKSCQCSRPQRLNPPEGSRSHRIWQRIGRRGIRWLRQKVRLRMLCAAAVQGADPEAGRLRQVGLPLRGSLPGKSGRTAAGLSPGSRARSASGSGGWSVSGARNMRPPTLTAMLETS
jgi:hypothetical protein